MPKMTHLVKKEQETPYKGTCCHEYDPEKESRNNLQLSYRQS